MNHLSLRADCARCAALCCVALAFDKSKLFGFDKPAGRRCPHLGDRGTCDIHADRERRGFGGCVSYDCLGAGQRVTQDIFGGRTWLEEPDLLAPMADAFLTLTRAHRLLLLLREAEGLPLSSDEQVRREGLEAAIVAAGAGRAAVSFLEDEAGAFLRSLRARLPPEP
jgi:hypothetical protein